MLGLFQSEAENTVFIVRLNLLRVNAGRQGERARELPEGPLHAVEVLTFNLGIKLAFAANRQDVVFDNDIDVVSFESRQVGLQNEASFRFINVRFRNQPLAVFASPVQSCATSSKIGFISR
jgi:hypothetical protein